ncbi:MAG: glycoside hydrolase family 2 TIM barrel-domain containing protein [Acidobacteriaceae bacterium]
MKRLVWKSLPVQAIAVVLLAVPVAGQLKTTVLVDADHRKALSLNGDWHYIVDPYDGGLYTFHREIRKDGFFLDGAPEIGSSGLIEYDFSKSPTLRVPGDWNTQHDSLFYYEGLLWYQRDFTYEPIAGHKTFLHIGAANYKSIAWVNGQEACSHEGGFTAFDCDVSASIHRGKNFVVIAVDNTRLADGVPTLNTDWWNYGGLTRDVSLIDVPAKYIDDYDLHLNRERTAIEGSVHVEGAEPGEQVTVSLPELGRSASARLGADHRARFSLSAAGVAFWTPEQPKLYQVRLQAADDSLDDEMGFRTIEVRGTDILLNGKPVFLRGISIHAEAPIRGGRANTDQDAAMLLGWAKELDCNYVRLAHYPHDERMTREADRLGLMVWSEIPVYWAEHFDDPAVLAKAEQQLGEEIRRDRNKASIVLWSIANETPLTPERTAFLKTLAADVHALDSTRLVTAALLVRSQGHDKYVDDPLGEALDVIGMNEYIGWYEQLPQDADTTAWHVAYQKPLIVSEFGGDAKAGLHGAATQRWTEEYQASIFRHQLPMLAKIPQFRGLSPWILMDFRSPMRQLPGLQDGYNRKGLVSNRGQKKEAFFVLQKTYREWAISGPASGASVQTALGASNGSHSPAPALKKVANPDK